MKRFTPCLIKLDQDDTARFLAAAQEILAAPWSHVPHPDFPEFIHFRREQVAPCPTVILSLHCQDSETLKVSNIIPREGALSYEQWNAILSDFKAAVLNKMVGVQFGHLHWRPGHRHLPLNAPNRLAISPMLRCPCRQTLWLPAIPSIASTFMSSSPSSITPAIVWTRLTSKPGFSNKTSR